MVLRQRFKRAQVCSGFCQVVYGPMIAVVSLIFAASDVGMHVKSEVTTF